MSAPFGREQGARSATAELDRRAAEAGADYEVGLESLSQWQLAWRKFKRHRLAMIGLGILLVHDRGRDRRADPHAVRLRRRSRARRDRATRAAAPSAGSTRSARPAASSATS